MKQTIIVCIVLWLLLIATVSCTRAGEVGNFNQFMGDQVYSVYLERQNHIHEAAMMHVYYNPELDKSLGIEIDLLCNAWGRTAKQCWTMMLFVTGAEFTSYKGF